MNDIKSIINLRRLPSLLETILYQAELESKCQQFGSSQVGECRVRVLKEYGEAIKCKLSTWSLLCAAAANLAVDGKGEVMV